jgi:DNA polymerase-3 subunit beta
MKITLEAGTLADALTYVTKVVPARTPIPILSQVRIEVADGALILDATDLDLAHRAQIAIEGGEPGVAVVPAARLAGLVAGLPADAMVTLELEDGRLRMAWKRSRWVLPILPADQFPAPLALADDAVRFTLTADTAQTLVKRVLWANSKEETRYYLNGTSLQWQEKQLVAVGTTGHVLAKQELDIDVKRDLNVIVPRPSMNTLHALARAGGDVEVCVDNTKIEFSSGPFLAVSKVVDATFPDYARVIPFASENRIVVKSADLLAAVERLQSVAEDSKRGSIVGLYWGDSPELEVCLAEAEENVEALDSTAAGAGCVAAQARLLIEALEALDAETVCLDHGSPGAPIIVTTPDDPAYLSLVMPARASGWSREQERMSAA